MKKAEADEQHQKSIERTAALFGLEVSSPRFVQAITHPSFSHESPGEPDNQRLEFLGDAILDFVVSEDLFERFDNYDEGQLTRARAQVVSTTALARFARAHELGAALRFGKGAGQGSLDESDNVLADAVEALIAATYRDQGIVGARRVCALVVDFGMRLSAEPESRDTKSELQERVQAIGLKAPIYKVVGSQGPAHEVVFEVEVSVGGQALSRGSGRSKRLAERAAAELALKEKKYEELAREGG